MGKVLIIDDDTPIAEALARVVERLGHTSDTCSRLAAGQTLANTGDYDVVLLDVRLPDGNGLDAIAELQGVPSAPEVIVITGWGDPDGAEAAMRRGAWDYIEKPPTLKAMSMPLLSALAYRESRSQAKAEAFVWSGIPGSHPARAKSVETASRAARSEASVLLTGETGTGKELFARAIHANSRRGQGAFVPVDCASLPASIVESVLFGNEKGAFTGADRPREGLIVQAHGGTLFLDEVGELPEPVQKALLRVLQERTVRPVGSPTERTCDFRLVAATHRDLEQMVRLGQFREDLLFRLRGMVIELPPLREHAEDVLLFARHFLAAYCTRYAVDLKILSPAFEAALMAYNWPGNIRELMHAMEGVVALALDEPVLHPVHLPVHIRVRVAREQVRDKEPQFPNKTPDTSEGPLPSLRDYREDMERVYLQELLRRSDGKIPEACRLSGLSRSRLYALLKTHGLTA